MVPKKAVERKSRDIESSATGSPSRNRDVDPEKDRVEHLNRVLQSIRSVGQLINRERNKRRLVEQICDQLTSTRGYSTAWLVLVDGNGEAVSYSQSGLGKKFQPLFNQFRQGIFSYCIEKTVRHEGLVVINKPDENCGDCVLYDDVPEDRAMTTRLIHDNRLYGYLSVAIPRDFTIDDQEQTLFQDVADDIARALFQIEKDLDKKIVESRLKESRERFQALFDNMSSGVAVYEAVDDGGDFIFKDFNRAGERIENVARENIIGRRVTEVFPGIREFGLYAIFQRVWRTGESEYHPDRIYEDEKGAGKWRENWVYKLPSGEIVAVYNDISERKNAEGALLAKSEEQKILLDSIQSQIWYLSDPETCGVVNEARAHFLNLQKNQIEGKKIHQILGEQEARACIAGNRRAFEKKKKTMTEEWVRNGAGKKRLLVISRTPKLNNNGSVEYVVCTADDITEKKAAEKERAEMQEQIRRSQRLETIGTLAGGIAHDFNNILTPIYGYVDMALEDISESSPLREYLEQILKGADRARDLVQQVLTFSRQVEREKRPTRLHLIIKEAVKLLRPTLPSTIEIRQLIDADCSKVLADPSQIHQVVMNLCTNAYHAMEKEGGTLVVELKELVVDTQDVLARTHLTEGLYACLTVRDTGVGMSPGELERIFEPFYTTKSVGKGTGLGLSVVHGIVSEHHGDIIVDSEKGKGTTFQVFLPVVSSESEAMVQLQEAATGGSERILIVDDEEPIAELLSRMLSRFGYSVEKRTSSVEALAAFRAKPENFDLVITDLTMPNMTGLDLTKAMHEIRPDIPVILISGFSEILPSEVVTRSGVCATLTKPVIANEMAARIRSVLDKSQ